MSVLTRLIRASANSWPMSQCIIHEILCWVTASSAVSAMVEWDHLRIGKHGVNERAAERFFMSSCSS